jgi:hypothetical protein
MCVVSNEVLCTYSYANFSLVSLSSKELYLADLRTLEQTKIISSGCFVAADNVVVFQIDDYRQYLSQLANMGIVETELLMGHLEYIDPTVEGHLKDGLECTIYRKDPPLI